LPLTRPSPAFNPDFTFKVCPESRRRAIVRFYLSRIGVVLPAAFTEFCFSCLFVPSLEQYRRGLEARLNSSFDFHGLVPFLSLLCTVTNEQSVTNDFARCLQDQVLRFAHPGLRRYRRRQSNRSARIHFMFSSECHRYRKEVSRKVAVTEQISANSFVTSVRSRQYWTEGERPSKSLKGAKI
jgi:hypothetical protein